MKKLIAVSSLLALALAGSGLFAYDILNSEGEKSGFSLNIEARYGFDIETPNLDDPTFIFEDSGDPQSKVKVGVSYDGDNYAFGLGAGWEKRYTDAKDFYLDNAWGKYYFLKKQLWLRAGSMDGLWRIDTDPLKKNYAGDNGPGLQINFAPSSLTGLNVGVALPVPLKDKREIVKGVDGAWEWNATDSKMEFKGKVDAKYGNWAPTYPFTNLAFGLRLNGTFHPKLDIGLELDLLGQQATNGKAGNDEKEGEFQGMNGHITVVGTIAFVTVKGAFLAEGFANGVSGAADPQFSAGLRFIFDIPNGEGSRFDWGDPWIQGQGLPSAKKESFKDWAVDFEWEPNVSIVKDQFKFLFKFIVGYKYWADATDPQKEYPVDLAVQPKLEFKFAPNATLAIHDKITFLQKEKKTLEKSFKNQLGFRFKWDF